MQKKPASPTHGISGSDSTGYLVASQNGISYYCPSAVRADDLVVRMAPEKWSYGIHFNGLRQRQAKPIAKLLHEVFRDHAAAFDYDQKAAPEAIKKLCIAKVRKVYGMIPLLVLLPVVISIANFLWTLYSAWRRRKQEQDEKNTPVVRAT